MNDSLQHRPHTYTQRESVVALQHTAMHCNTLHSLQHRPHTYTHRDLCIWNSDLSICRETHQSEQRLVKKRDIFDPCYDPRFCCNAALQHTITNCNTKKPAKHWNILDPRNCPSVSYKCEKRHTHVKRPINVKRDLQNWNILDPRDTPSFQKTMKTTHTKKIWQPLTRQQQTVKHFSEKCVTGKMTK